MYHSCQYLSIVKLRKRKVFLFFVHYKRRQGRRVYFLFIDRPRGGSRGASVAPPRSERARGTTERGRASRGVWRRPSRTTERRRARQDPRSSQFHNNFLYFVGARVTATRPDQFAGRQSKTRPIVGAPRIAQQYKILWRCNRDKLTHPKPTKTRPSRGRGQAPPKTPARAAGKKSGQRIYKTRRGSTRERGAGYLWRAMCATQAPRAPCLFLR